MFQYSYISYLQRRALDILNPIPESKVTETHLRALNGSTPFHILLTMARPRYPESYY